MIIRSTKVFYKETFQPLDIEIENRKIIKLAPYNSLQADVDYNNWRIIPGMIDIHCHGAYGFDTNYALEEGLINWKKHIVEEGVTSFLATTITDAPETLRKALRNVAKVKAENTDGANILGVHLEGPYLDETYCGAQPKKYIIPADIKQFEQFQKDAEGNIRVVTYAPEHDIDFKFTEYLSSHNIIPSMGHSGATIHTASQAIEHGAKSITHTFNGMPPFHHRNAGLANAALFHHDTYSEIICDTHHVVPEVLNIFFRCKNKDKAIMISDSLYVKGLPAGTEFLFGGQEVILQEDGSAKLKNAPNLAGSTMKMNEGLRNLIEIAHIPETYAILASSTNPATLLGIGNQKGKIEEGFDADITILADDYKVVQTFVGGKTQL